MQNRQDRIGRMIASTLMLVALVVLLAAIPFGTIRDVIAPKVGSAATALVAVAVAAVMFVTGLILVVTRILRSRGTWIRLTVAVTAVVMAGCAHVVKDVAFSWLGPPRVVMIEAYGGDTARATFDHATFDTLLGRVVDDQGLVDYAELARDPAELDAYLDQLATAPFADLSRDGKLALLINAYNACTLRLILDYWDDGRIRSIRDISDSKRWEARRWEIAGTTRSLNDIEHGWIRSHFEEPRIHFALVCAAIGCPPLRSEAYVADRLEQQLDEQTRRVHANRRWFVYERNRLSLTPLYDWYAGDFEQAAGSAQAFAARYDAALTEDLAAGRRPTVAWMPYDWSLNRQAETDTDG